MRRTTLLVLPAVLLAGALYAGGYFGLRLVLARRAAEREPSLAALRA